MTGRIKIWSSRNLSYTARVQLINSVLLSLRMYWAHVFLLPKKILQEICSICRFFFMEWTVLLSKTGSVAWDSLCKPKSAGGLGFRNVMLWNIAFIGKYVYMGSCYKAR